MNSFNCYARWRIDAGLKFRDQTILQFGESWHLLATIVLLNPGSAEPVEPEPVSDKSLQDRLISYGLSVAEKGDGEYRSFKIDPLMRSVVKLFLSRYKGGVIKLLNLFNLKDPKSTSACKQMNKYRDHQFMFTPDKEIYVDSAPVVFACGKQVLTNELLKKQLSRVIDNSTENPLFKNARIADRKYSFVSIPNSVKAEEIDCYHLSYTCKYGNRTCLGEFQY